MRDIVIKMFSVCLFIFQLPNCLISRQVPSARQTTRRGLARTARSILGLAPSEPQLSDSGGYEAEHLRLIPDAISVSVMV